MHSGIAFATECAIQQAKQYILVPSIKNCCLDRQLTKFWNRTKHLPWRVVACIDHLQSLPLGSIHPYFDTLRQKLKRAAKRLLAEPSRTSTSQTSVSLSITPTAQDTVTDRFETFLLSADNGVCLWERSALLSELYTTAENQCCSGLKPWYIQKHYFS